MSAGTNERTSKGRSGFKAGVAARVMGVLILGAAAMPLAAAQVIGPDVTVRYADLNINTEAGAEKLYERIRHAAARVCPIEDLRPLAEHAAATRCRNEVVAQAVSRVSSAQLTAIYTARAHRGAHSPV
jgi:UrcA family protein